MMNTQSSFPSSNDKDPFIFTEGTLLEEPELGFEVISIVKSFLVTHSLLRWTLCLKEFNCFSQLQTMTTRQQF
jgi:hypothetical protein